MDFAKLLPHCKLMYYWLSEEDVRDIEVQRLDRDSLYFKKSLPLPIGSSPELLISLKVRHVSYEHSFKETEWIIGEDGQVCGLRLLGPAEELLEWKKNLEMGLCV